LDDILLLVLCGTMAGADDFVEIAQWGNEKIDFLRRMRPFEKGIPAHDTLNDVFNALPAELFSEYFMCWAEGLRGETLPETVAIDGKASRRAHAKDGKPLHLVSAWASRARLVLGQASCDEKSNEITAIPRLLEHLELTGALVTLDAMGCQSEIAKAIRSKGADYLLALKQNWPLLYAEVELFFSDARNVGAGHETLEKGHGRVEKRVHHVCHDVGWVKDGARFPGQWDFPGLATIGRVQSTVERDGVLREETRYYLSSACFSSHELAVAVRNHWHVENRLHWVLDVVFHDDLMRLRTGHGPQNMAVVRHFSLNLIRGAKGKASLKVRRKKLGWNEEYLYQTLTQA
jgi:predicted transposase YbfD/YdcC